MPEIFTSLFAVPFLKNALIAAVLAGVAAGPIGTFVSLKRMATISGGIAHAVVGGVGLAYFLGGPPFWGALAAAVFFALIFGFARTRFGERDDILIAAFWSIGMAAGVLFASLTPGYNVDLMSYLFGNILLVTPGMLVRLAAIDVFAAVILAIFWRQLIYVAFDEEYAAIRGLNVGMLNTLLLLLVALTVVVLMQITGLILVIALMTLPPAVARMAFSRPSSISIASSAIGIITMVTGITVSFYTNIPAGAAIVLCAGGVYLAALSIRHLPASQSLFRGMDKAADVGRSGQ